MSHDPQRTNAHEITNHADLEDTGMKDEVIAAVEKLENAGLLERTGEMRWGKLSCECGSRFTCLRNLDVR